MELDYNEIFGLEPAAEETADESVKEQEPAEPAETVEEPGEKEQDVAEPVVEEAGDNASNEPAEAPKEEQPPEKRSEFAAARRKAEAEMAKLREDLEAKHAEDIKTLLADLNVQDETGKTLETREDVERWKDQQHAEQTERIAKRTGMSDEDIRAYVESAPEVRAYKIAADRAKAAEERVKQQSFQLELEEQMKQISALDPSITGINDLVTLPTYDAMKEYVAKGNSLSDAYKLANWDTLQTRAAEGAKQAARNAAGKAHLTSTQTRGQGTVAVPEDIKAEYRIWNPKATDAEIAAHYNKSLRKES